MESLYLFKNYTFKDKNLLQEALTHKSIKGANEFHNEKLEFLGDAVLNLAISDLLMEAYPEFTEGDLTKLRAGLVSGETLGEIAHQLKFYEHLKVGKTLSPENPRLLADAFEAYLGALYLDSDFINAKKIIGIIFKERIQNKDFSTDYKSHLQEWCQKKYQNNPYYKLKKEEGLEHKKIFYMDVLLSDKVLGSGHDNRKKKAEQKAAESACTHLNIEINPSSNGKVK